MGETFTVSGVWTQDQADLLDKLTLGWVEREVVYIPEYRRVLWIDWWPERIHMTVKVTDSRMEPSEDALDPDEEQFSLDMQPIGPARVERAAWWRRCGYQVVKRLPVLRGMG